MAADYTKLIRIEVDTKSAQQSAFSFLSSLEKKANEVNKFFKNIPNTFNNELSEAFKSIESDAKEFTKLMNTIDANRKYNLNVDVDKKKLEELQAKLSKSDAGKIFLSNFAQNAENKITQSKEKTPFQKDIDYIKKKYDPIQQYKENGKYETVLGATIGKFAAMMSNAIKSIGNFFVKTFKESFKSLKEIAEYDAGTTLYSNQKARERQLIFGLSGAQNYAMSTAMTMLGMSGIEDLLWANAKQKEQYDKMTAILEAQYSKLESSGILATAQQFQLDMSMMKLQFQNTVYQFIAAHRSQLETVLSMALKFMEGTLNMLGGIVDWLASIFGNSNYGSFDNQASSSTISNNDNSRVINTTINYTNNQSDNPQGNAISSSVMQQLIAVLNS